MRSASNDLKAFLAANRTCSRYDLLTMTLPNTTVVRLTTCLVPITIGAETWLPSGGATTPLYERDKLTQTCGLEIDEIDITLRGPLWVDGSGFNRTGSGQLMGVAAINKYFDRAKIQLHYLMSAEPADVSLGAISNVFYGSVSSAVPESSDVILRCCSYVEDLKQNIPRYILHPQCGNQLFGAACALNVADWSVNGAVLEQANSRVITSESVAVADKANGYFNFGAIKFANGEVVGVSSNQSSGGVATIFLSGSTQYIYNPDDTFTIYAGCDKSFSRCGFFSNQAHFRGFRSVPRKEKK